jgi:hypothetical protein
MALKFRKKAVLAKIETTYGTDSTPVGATDAILLKNVTITPMQAEAKSRDLVRETLGATAQSLVGLHVGLECEVELAGSGTAGDVPGYGPLLRACALAETINAGTDVEYDPVSSGEESVTIYFNIDGSQHKMLGTRGTVAFSFNAGDVPAMRFRFTGMWGDPSAVALPTTVLTGFQKPLHVGNTNTPTFTVHAYAAVMRRIEFDLANDVGHRDLVGSESVQFVDRSGSGSVLIEAPALGTQDFFAVAKAETLAAVQLIHGLTAGNIVQVDAPKVQLLTPAYEDDRGIAMLNMNLVLTPDSGDDEFQLTVK